VKNKMSHFYGSLCTFFTSSDYRLQRPHYAGEVENVYMILQQIYSGNHKPNFIKIAQVL